MAENKEETLKGLLETGCGVIDASGKKGVILLDTNIGGMIIPIAGDDNGIYNNLNNYSDTLECQDTTMNINSIYPGVIGSKGIEIKWDSPFWVFADYNESVVAPLTENLLIALEGLKQAESNVQKSMDQITAQIPEETANILIEECLSDAGISYADAETPTETPDETLTFKKAAEEYCCQTDDYCVSGKEDEPIQKPVNDPDYNPTKEELEQSLVDSGHYDGYDHHLHTQNDSKFEYLTLEQLTEMFRIGG